MYAHLNLDILTIPDIYKLRGRDLEIAVAKAKGYTVAEFVEGNYTLWSLLDPTGSKEYNSNSESDCWNATMEYLKAELACAWLWLLEELREEGHEPELNSSINGWFFRAYIDKSTLESPHSLISNSGKRSVETVWLMRADLALGACQVYLLLKKALREENPWGLIEDSEGAAK